MMNKIAFIGAGNMNSAIILGLLQSGVSPENIIVSNPSAEKREALAKQHGIKQTASNVSAAEFADTIVLGVKPHFIAEVCQEIGQAIDIADKCFLSVAAGTTVATIQQALGMNAAVVRTMPNTPSQLGLGITGAYPSPEVSEAQKVLSESLITAVGDIVWLTKENQIDNITAVSGSGPAYFFLFMEAMEKEAKSMGFNEAQSRLLVQQTALGAATMVKENPIAISQLRENVTSKGGTTQAALTTFNDGELTELVASAMQAAVNRAQEMAQNG